MAKEAKSRKTKKGYDLKPAIAALRQRRLERESNGVFPAEFMRLSLTDDAYNIVKGMGNAAFREFVSSAVRRAAKRR